MIKVMVIEDRILTLNALKSQVPWESRGLEPVGFYTNCKEAMEEIEKHEPDVIVSDIVMPGMDGLSFCEYINSLNRNIKIIIISAYSKFEYAKRGIKLGVYDFLEKPVDYAELCEKIAKAGEEKRREEQVQKVYADSRNLYQEAFFLKLLKDDQEAGKLKKEQITGIVGTNIEGIQFNCITVSVENEGSGMPWEGACEAIMKVLSSNYPACTFWGPFLYQTNVYCIVLGSEKDILKKEFDEVLRAGIDNVMEVSSEIHVSIGVGYWGDDIGKLRFSAESSVRALEYRFVFGKDSAYSIRDYAEKKLADYTKFDYFEKNLIKYLECGDYDGIRKTNKEMRKYMEKHHISKSYLVFFITDFLSAQVCLADSESPDQKDYLFELNRMAYISDIFAYFEKILFWLCQEQRETLVPDAANAVDRIQKYINENFKSENLSLAGIAQIFNMSPNYICRIFKEKTGNTLMNYINDLKIQKAKEMLVQTDKKIWEIAQELGYSNQYYFSIGFKKATGYSPKNYRNLEFAEEKTCRGKS